jgi:hypothetical protein
MMIVREIKGGKYMRNILKAVLFRAIVSLIVLTASIPIMAQDSGKQGTSQLYFLSGIPNWDPQKGDVDTAIQILRVLDDNTALTPVTTLATVSSTASFIRAYHNERIVVIGSPQNDITNLIILKMDAPCQPQTLKIDKGFSTLNTYLLDIPNKGLYLAKEGFNLKNKGSQLLTYSLVTGQTEPMAPDILKYAELPGDSGVTLNDKYMMDVFLDEKGVVWKSWITELNPNGFNLNWIALPHSAQPDSRTGTIQVNGVLQPMADATWYIGNKNINLLNVPGSAPEKKFNYWLFDKTRDAWRKIVMPGKDLDALPKLKAFGTWLAGVLVGKAVDTPEEISAAEDKIKKAGRENDNAYHDYLMMNSQQVIYIYDTKSDQSYKIKTDDIVTEVLLIENNTVYYRVNDRLYQATLSNGEAIGTKLIVQDPALVNVYWAFIGPKCEAAAN